MTIAVEAAYLFIIQQKICANKSFPRVSKLAALRWSMLKKSPPFFPSAASLHPIMERQAGQSVFFVAAEEDALYHEGCNILEKMQNSYSLANEKTMRTADACAVWPEFLQGRLSMWSAQSIFCNYSLKSSLFTTLAWLFGQMNSRFLHSRNMLAPQQRTGLETLFLAGIDEGLYPLGRAMNFAQSVCYGTQPEPT
jgi:hypothetical protein